MGLISNTAVQGALLMLLGIPAVDAQMPECLVRLEPPSYPPFSWGLQDEQTVDVSLRLEGSGATVLDAPDTEDEFLTEAQRVARLSTFSAGCNGRTLRLRLQFALRGDASLNRQSEVTFELDETPRQRRLSLSADRQPNIIVVAAPPTASICERTITTPEQAAECYGQGTQLSAEKRYIDAIRCFDRKLSIAPEPAAYVERGIARRKSGQLKAALGDYGEAIRLKPDYAIAFFDRGNVFRDMGAQNEAIADYSEALRLDPSRREAYGNRALEYMELRMFQLALSDLNELLKKNLRDRKAYLNRGVAYSELGLFDQAIADYDQAIRLSPREADAYNNRGSARVNMGQPQLAIADYTTAIQLKPDYFEAWLGRAVAQDALHQYQQAVDDITKAIELRPNSAFAYETRANIYLKSGSPTPAAADLEKARALQRK